jgi:hypothetical protein
MLGRWLAGGSALLAAATLLACASSPGTSADEPSRAAPSREPTLHGTAGACGSVPTSSGPLAHVAHLAITAPATVSAGRSVAVSAAISSKSVVPRVITTPATSALLVVRDDRIVGRALGSASAPNVPLQLRAGKALPAQAIPGSIRLTGCRSGSRAAVLPAGRYALVAVLGYELDSLNAAPAGGTAPPPTGGRNFALVSAPAPIIVG